MLSKPAATGNEHSAGRLQPFEGDAHKEWAAAQVSYIKRLVEVWQFFLL